MNKILTAIAGACLCVLPSCQNRDEYDASGNFEATEITISAETAGKILNFDIEEGDSVSPGQTVAMLDSTQFVLQRRQLECQLAASDANRPDIALQLAASRSELEKQIAERRRVENLLADGAAATKQLDDINAAINVLAGKIAAQESALNNSAVSIDCSTQAIQAQIDQLTDKIDDCRIVVTTGGTVLTKYREAGEYAMPGQPLLKVADLGRVYLRAYLTSAQIAEVRLGQKVTVYADFGGDHVYEYPGTVTWISAESEFTPKNIQTRDSRSHLVYAVKIAVRNDGRVKIGGYGRVRL